MSGPARPPQFGCDKVGSSLASTFTVPLVQTHHVFVGPFIAVARKGPYYLCRGIFSTAWPFRKWNPIFFVGFVSRRGQTLGLKEVHLKKHCARPGANLQKAALFRIPRWDMLGVWG